MENQSYSAQNGHIYTNTDNTFVIWESGKDCASKLSKNNEQIYRGSLLSFITTECFWDNFGVAFLDKNISPIENCNNFLLQLVNMYTNKEKRDYILGLNSNTEICVFKMYFK